MAQRNLFVVDVEAVRALLVEANAPIEKRSRDLLAALGRVPPLLETDDEMQRAVKFSHMLKQQMQECRQARLSDGQPFKEAARVIDAYFADFEKPLKAAFDQVLKIIGRSQARRSARPSPAPASETPPPVPLVKTGAGDTVVESVPPSPAFDGSAVRLAWVVKGVDRTRIELEPLRPYLTENALLQAAAKHLREHGPHRLDASITSGSPN